MITYKESLFGVDEFVDGVKVANRTVQSSEYLAWLSEGNTPEPADPLPNPRIAEIKAELASIDQKSIRAIREGDTQRIAEWEAQAQTLRAELGALNG